MRIDILTLFPAVFKGFLGESIVKRAIEKKRLAVKTHNIRDWTHDRHHSVDDTPYGGGPGMVMKVEPVCEALTDLKVLNAGRPAGLRSTRVILLTPQGRRLDQPLLEELAAVKRLILICGHYEGFDERIRSLVTDEVSIGDYVLTGGEVPAMAIVEGVGRLITGVVGDPESIVQESFTTGLLEHPHYTKPRVYKGMKVPDILLSGDHGAIKAWRHEQAVKRTKERRPDLLA